MYFLVMFWFHLFHLMFGGLFTISIKNGKALVPSTLLNILASFGSLIMLIIGTYWRFGHTGQVCSGDLAYAIVNETARNETLM